MSSLYVIFIEEILEKAMERALDLGAEDFSGWGGRGQSFITRFSNNLITVTKFYDISTMNFYIGYKRRRTLARIDEIDEKVALGKIEEMIRTAKNMKPSKFYTRLPSGDIEYNPPPGRYDPKMIDLDEKNIDIVEGAINSALESGARKVSGVLASSAEKNLLITSGGRRGEYRSSEIALNVRAFRDGESSGHGVAVSTYLDGLDYEGAGEKAGSLSKMAEKPKVVKPGVYDALLSPVVMADLLSAVSMGTSAFYVESGLSPFEGKIGEKVLDEKLTICDDPTIEGNPGAVPFDVEGTPTRSVTMIKRGVLETYCHNSSTAEKYGVESTGHAGVIVPLARSVVVEPGEVKEEDMMRELGDGVYVTNTWYTRFQNYKTGEFSSIPRDAAFMVEKGEIKHPVKGMRISDSLMRMLKSIRNLSEERSWVRLWGQELPALTPSFTIEKLNITTGHSRV
ncbi:MAG: TldD/PmbA family protein [Candidatus Geothermarchaeales archaeon]